MSWLAEMSLDQWGTALAMSRHTNEAEDDYRARLLVALVAEPITLPDLLDTFNDDKNKGEV